MSNEKVSALDAMLAQYETNNKPKYDKKEKVYDLKNYFNNSKIISIAKGRQELFIEGKKEPVPLKNLPQEIRNLILRLDDEAHRFAITYHKKLRKKDLLS